jgi:hypothetical protein
VVVDIDNFAGTPDAALATGLDAADTPDAAVGGLWAPAGGHACEPGR